MAYRLTYGDGILFDPYTNDVVYDAKLTAKSNNADYLDFTVPRTHALYGEVRERGEVVRLEWDGEALFLGEVESIEVDTEGNKEVACVGALGWLADTVVRPYSTLEGEQPNTAPSTVDGLFAWYVDRHNAHTLDDRRRFAVGVNQGWALDENNHVYRSSEQLPTTWDEISDKILGPLGGYVLVGYDPLTVNLYADVHDTNVQVIDFGVNITDFSETVDAADTYTAVRAVGKAPDKEEGSDEEPAAPTLADLPDGKTNADGIYKLGDVVYSADAVARYGYRECAYSDNDCATAAGLLTSAVKRLQALMAPTLTVTVKAVDLALFMGGHDHLKVGQAVRVRSAFHGVDEFLMVSSATIDLQDPGNTEYTLGAECSTLTGQQSGYLRAQTASINAALDATTALSGETKATAKAASDAAGAAETAQASADAANGAAAAAKAAADTAQSSAEKAATDAAANLDEARRELSADAAAKADQAKAEAIEAAAADAATKADAAKEAAVETAQSYADAQVKLASDSITSTVSETYETKADAANTKTQVTQNADSITTLVSRADSIDTLIRESSDGIEVGKSTDGETYEGTHTLVGTDKFSIHDKDHNELAVFTDESVELGKNSDESKIDMINGALTVTTTDTVDEYNDRWKSERVTTSIENVKLPEGTDYKFCSSKIELKTSRQARDLSIAQYITNQYGDATISIDSYEIANEIQLNVKARVLNDDGSLNRSYDLCKYLMSAYASKNPNDLSGYILEQAGTKTLSLEDALSLYADGLGFGHPKTVSNSYTDRKFLDMSCLLGFIDALNNTPRRSTIQNSASGMYCQALESPVGVHLGANSTGTTLSTGSRVCQVYTVGQFANKGEIYIRGVFHGHQSGVYAAYGTDGHTITITTEQAPTLSIGNTMQVFIPCRWTIPAKTS